MQKHRNYIECANSRKTDSDRHLCSNSHINSFFYGLFNGLGLFTTHLYISKLDENVAPTCCEVSLNIQYVISSSRETLLTYLETRVNCR